MDKYSEINSAAVTTFNQMHCQQCIMMLMSRLTQLGKGNVTIWNYYGIIFLSILLWIIN